MGLQQVRTKAMKVVCNPELCRRLFRMSYYFKAVTAAVISGVLVMGLLINLMTFLGITAFRQNILTGIVFITVVGLQQYRLRVRGKDYV